MDNDYTRFGLDTALPHDVVKLPSKGIFYKPKKESLKVGYLTATDENLLMSNITLQDGLVYNLLKNKIYEPGFDVGQLINSDVEAVLIFLRNTSFGSEYNFRITDPATNKSFESTLQLDELDFKSSIHNPNEEGLFEYVLPKSNSKVKCKILNLNDDIELEKFKDSYPKNMVAPIITKKLEKQIVELDGSRDKQKIAQFISKMPISDSKDLRKFLFDCEPGIDLKRTVIAPSGEKVTFQVAFGAEFFRPFFSL